MQHLEQHRSFLELLAKTHSTQRKSLLLTASKQQLNILSEITHNFLQGVVPLDVEQIAEFAKDRNILRKIAQKNLKSKRLFITKHNKVLGNFLQMILTKLES